MKKSFICGVSLFLLASCGKVDNNRVTNSPAAPNTEGNNNGVSATGQSQMDTLNQQVSILQTQVNQLSAQIGNTANSDLIAKIANFNPKIVHLQQEITANTESIDTLNAEFNSLVKEFETIQNQVNPPNNLTTTQLQIRNNYLLGSYTGTINFTGSNNSVAFNFAGHIQVFNGLNTIAATISYDNASNSATDNTYYYLEDNLFTADNPIFNLENSNNNQVYDLTASKNEPRCFCQPFAKIKVLEVDIPLENTDYGIALKNFTNGAHFMKINAIHVVPNSSLLKNQMQGEEACISSLGELPVAMCH